MLMHSLALELTSMTEALASPSHSPSASLLVP